MRPPLMSDTAHPVRPPSPLQLSYALVTPARNEAEFIGDTIEAVCAQTVLPRRWVVVSDGSTDGTDDIIKRYAARHSWIEYVRRPPQTERHFAAKVQCFNTGYQRLDGIDYDIVGNLDADITFEKDYLEFLLGRFAADETLGVAGTPFTEKGVQYDYRFANVEH